MGKLQRYKTQFLDKMPVPLRRFLVLGGIGNALRGLNWLTGGLVMGIVTAVMAAVWSWWLSWPLILKGFFVVGLLFVVVGVVGRIGAWLKDQKQLSHTDNTVKIDWEKVEALRTARTVEEQRWRDEIDHFKLVALDFWRLLIASFSRSDIHGSAIDWDSLSPTVRNACWPSEEPSDRDVAMATAQVRELTRRIYSLDGKTLFNVDESSEFEAIRHPMNETLKKWGAVLSGPHCDRLTALLGDNLVPHDRETIKLLQYVEESNAASTKHHDPDHRHFDMVRAALMPQEPDTEVPSRARVTLDKEWRAERKEFEKVHEAYRDEVSQVASTLKNLLIKTGGRQVTTTWHDYLPKPGSVDADFYIFCGRIWREGRSTDFFGSKASLEAFKAACRGIYAFFDNVYVLLQDFPDHAPAYINDEVRRHQHDMLNLAWHLGHTLADLTFGERKAEMYDPPPNWLRLWADWNPGVVIPPDPLDLPELNYLKAILQEIPVIEAKPLLPKITPSTPYNEAPDHPESEEGDPGT